MPAETTKDFAPGLEKCLLPNVSEQSYRIESVQGEIPAYLRGTYYLNGPAKFEVGGLRYRNWLDGDGMVCALRFEDQGVTFTNRFVAGRKFLEETERDAPIYAAFGTRFAGDRMRRGIATESPYNVSVLRFRGSLLAFGEQSMPMELHPETLETLGEYSFDRQINALSPFSAHPKIDPETGEFLNFGISFAGRQPCVNYYRFQPDGKLAARKRTTIDYACSIHDFAVSKRFAVIYLCPYVLDITQLLQAGVATVDALHWQPELGSSLLVLSRDDGAEVARIPCGDRYCLHTINSFDEGEKLTIDLIELDRPVYDQYQQLPDLFSDVPQGRPSRILVDLADRTIKSRFEIPYAAAPDFPVIDPRRQMHACNSFWMLGISTTGKPGRKFFEQLVHANWSTSNLDIYQAPAGRYLGGEPAFVPDPNNEASGALICQEMDARSSSSDFIIFDAFGISRGPVARVHLTSPIHFGFHTSFYPE